MEGKVEGVVVGAKPGHHSHLNHRTKSWNSESQPRSCWTQIHLGLDEGSPHQAGTMALGLSLADIPCAADGGNGDVGMHTMHV